MRTTPHTGAGGKKKGLGSTGMRWSATIWWSKQTQSVTAGSKNIHQHISSATPTLGPREGEGGRKGGRKKPWGWGKDRAENSNPRKLPAGSKQTRWWQQWDTSWEQGEVGPVVAQTGSGGSHGSPHEEVQGALGYASWDLRKKTRIRNRLGRDLPISIWTMETEIVTKQIYVKHGTVETEENLIKGNTWSIMHIKWNNATFWTFHSGNSVGWRWLK